MDELDKSIIEILTTDARTSYRKVARELDKSTETVISRYQRLQKAGEIRGSTVVVDLKSIGYGGMAAFNVDVSGQVNRSDSERILRTIIRMPNIIVATKTVGDHDLLALGVIHDFDHMMRLSSEISSIPGVENIQASVWAAKGEICPRYFII